MRNCYDRIPDWLWPHLTGRPIPAPADSRLLAKPYGGAMLEAVERVASRRVDSVGERLRAVETKLLALLTLTSILSAGVSAGLVAASTMVIDKDFPRVLVWISCALIVYLGANLLCALWATVGGLTRRSFGYMAYKDIAPRADEDTCGYRARLVDAQLRNARWNDWVIDQKVSDLAVAHAALRNSLLATAGVILMALAIALLRLP